VYGCRVLPARATTEILRRDTESTLRTIQKEKIAPSQQHLAEGRTTEGGEPWVSYDTITLDNDINVDTKRHYPKSLTGNVPTVGC